MKSQTWLSDFTFTFHFSRIGEGNGNPLQCSCLENPRDGGAWWAAVSGVAQSRTWLKRLSSSSSYLFYTWWCICFNAILSTCPIFSFPHCIHKYYVLIINGVISNKAHRIIQISVVLMGNFSWKCFPFITRANFLWKFIHYFQREVIPDSYEKRSYTLFNH